MADKDFKVKNKLVLNGITQAGPLLADSNKQVDAVAFLTPIQGGTGTTTAPSSGQVLYSAGGTTYTPTTLTSLDVKGATYSADAPASPFVGQVWIESDSSSDSFDPNIIRRKTITATAGQTTFTTDLEFIQGYEQVYFNGMLLLRTSDYTTPSNTSVVLAAAAAAGDIVEILSITNLNSINAATTTTNTFTGAQTINLSSPAVPLTLRAASSGSANLLNILNGSGTAIGAISSSGELAVGSNSFLGGSNRLIVSGNTMINAGTDITPDINGAGHLRIGGNGYTGFATLDASGMWIGHNSSARDLIFATDETARMRIDGSGRVGIGISSPNTTLQVHGGGGWTAFNYGRQLYITTPSSSSNPAIAISDYAGTNLIGIVNNSTALSIISGPAITDSTSSPGTMLTIDRATGRINPGQYGYSQRITLATGAGFTNLGGSGFAIVHGYIGGNEFWDTLLGQFYGSLTVMSSATIGSPPTRTYSMNQSGGLGLSISGGTSGTYTIDLWRFN